MGYLEWGHYKTMREIMLNPRFDRIIFAPAGCSPDKADDYDQSKELRFKIASRIVIELKREFPNKEIILETYEFNRPGTTTHDALAHVQTKYSSLNLNPSNFVFVLGQDYIYTKGPDGRQAVEVERSQLRAVFGSSDLSAWNNIQGIFNMVSIAVIPRNHKGREAFKDTSTMDLSLIESVTGRADIAERVILIPMEPDDVSSSQIRKDPCYKKINNYWRHLKQSRQEHACSDSDVSIFNLPRTRSNRKLKKQETVAAKKWVGRLRSGVFSW